LNGRKIETLSNYVLAAGNHSFKWNSTTQKPGIYIVKLASADESITEKIQVFR